MHALSVGQTSSTYCVCGTLSTSYQLQNILRAKLSVLKVSVALRNSIYMSDTFLICKECGHFINQFGGQCLQFLYVF